MSATRPVRVGLVIRQLTTGGAEGQLRQVTRAIDRERFAPTVYCLTSEVEPIGELLRRDGVTLRVADVAGWRRVGWLARALAADDVEVVHSWLYIANAFAWAAMGLRRGWHRREHPLITSARNCKVHGPVNRLANWRAFRSSQAIVVNSQDVAAYIVQQYWAPRERTRVIYNGVDIDRFHPAGNLANGDVGPIVGVGRLVEQKNYALFLEAAARLAREVPAAQFAIAGDGPLRPRLEEQARQLGIADRVVFLGQRRDVEDVLRTASLFWLTSRWEGMPNVVLEAMASAVPVIATAVSGTRELIRSGVDGFVVPSEDAEGFVQHSRDILLDRARQRQMAAAARARAEEFSTGRMVGALSDLYDEVLGRGH